MYHVNQIVGVPERKVTKKVPYANFLEKRYQKNKIKRRVMEVGPYLRR